MSNIDKMTEITSENQDLFIEFNDQSAETISGGYEVFTIRNQTKYNVGYSVDGKSWSHAPNKQWRKLRSILFMWSVNKLFLNLTGLDDVSDYSEFISQINHQYIEARNLESILYKIPKI